MQINFWKEKDKENKPKAHKAHMVTNAHKLTLFFPNRITQNHSSRSFNEAHIGALLWLWIAHSQDLPTSHRIKFVRNLNDSRVGLLMPWVACSLFLPRCTRLFLHWILNERCMHSNLRSGSRWEEEIHYSFFYSFFLSSIYFSSFLL